MGRPNSRDGQFPTGGYPCTATNFQTNNGHRIEPLLPHRTHHDQAGHPFNDHTARSSTVSSGSCTPAPLGVISPNATDLEETVFYRFNRWRRDGTWNRIVSLSLLDELDNNGEIDHDLWCIDGSVIRASRAAAGARKSARPARRLGGRKEAQMLEPPDHALGRSRGGFGSKVHIVCDSRGTIVGIHLTAGQRHESKFFEPDHGPACCSTATRGQDAGRAAWRQTRATATRASGGGASTTESRR